MSLRVAHLFPRFRSLPAELRVQVWNQSLPDCITPAAFIYKRNCWRSSKRLVTSETDSTQQQGELSLEFCNDLLADVLVELPLFFACREARAVAVSWIQKQSDVRVRCVEDKIIITRAFDPLRDVLYIPPLHAAFDAFCVDPYDIWEADDMIAGVQIYTSASSVSNIAVHAGVLFEDSRNSIDLGLMLENWFGAVETVLIIVNSETGPQFTDHNHTLQDRWEFEMLPSMDAIEATGALEAGRNYYINEERDRLDVKVAEVKRILAMSATREQASKLDVQLVMIRRR